MNDHRITSVININNVQKMFRKGQKQQLLVLEKVNFEMKPGEIVALLGKSGSGKSTLLRIISGLVEPSAGEVYYRGARVNGPAQGISMVFQSFALMPWLTVLQNVELGLEAQGLGLSARRQRALQAIDMIGLDGFESAFPKELSGGMRQRVGFARALVVDPDILLMDEPFSALDVLTAENLKSDLLDLWQTKKTRLSGIIFVTHNIEEAIQLADRIVIFNANPGTIKSELRVDLPRPRNEQDPLFCNLVHQIYTLMTREGKEARFLRAGGLPKPMGLGYRLPDASVSALVGLLETLCNVDYQGRMNLPQLSEIVYLDVDDLFPLTEVLELMNFARVSEGDITVTPEGEMFARADLLERKKIFSKQLVNCIPLAKHIRDELDKDSRHQVSEQEFLAVLEEHLSDQEAERVLKVVIDWGRYAELFAYDFNTGMLSLENPG